MEYRMEVRQIFLLHVFHSVAPFIGVLIDIVHKCYKMEVSSPIGRPDNESLKLPDVF